MVQAFCVLSKIALPDPRVLSGCFMVFGLTFSSMVHFELILMYGVTYELK